MSYKQRFCATLLSSLVSLPALADMGNPYASGKVGWAWENISEIQNVSLITPQGVPSETRASQSLLSYGGAAGYRFNTFYLPVRLEVDYTYRNNLTYNPNPLYVGGAEHLKSTVQSQDVLGNIFIDIPVVEMFGFFVGGGGGLAFNHTTNRLFVGGAVLDSTTDRNAWAWMATAGFSVLPTHWLALDVSYRYSGLGSVRWTDFGSFGPDVVGTELNTFNFDAQEVFLTFRFTLPSRDKCCKKHVPYKPVVVLEPEPAPIRKPVNKSPEYKPHTKGAHYEPTKGAHYEPEKGATYDEHRAKAVKRHSNPSGY